MATLGDYLTVRANPLENNLVLWKFEKGKRSSVKWIRNTPTPTRQWHDLKVRVAGSKIEGCPCELGCPAFVGPNAGLDPAQMPQQLAAHLAANDDATRPKRAPTKARAKQAKPASASPAPRGRVTPRPAPAG